MRCSKIIEEVHRIVSMYSVGESFTLQQIKDLARVDLTNRQIGYALHLHPGVEKIHGHRPTGGNVWKVIA